MFKRSPYGLLRMCVACKETDIIMWHCHISPYGGHHIGERTTTKILQIGFWWPTLLMNRSYICPHAPNITELVTSQNEMRCL